MTKSESTNIADEADYIYKNLCFLYGEYFNYIREQKGLSLRDLSKQTGVSIALISLLENGDKLPRIETLIRLVLALGIKFSEIFGHKSAGLDFHFARKPIPAHQRDDEILRTTLLKMGCDKDDLKEILAFIEFKKYQKDMSMHIKPTSNTSKVDLIMNDGVHSEEFKHMKDVPVK